MKACVNKSAGRGGVLYGHQEECIAVLSASSPWCIAEDPELCRCAIGFGDGMVRCFEFGQCGTRCCTEIYAVDVQRFMDPAAQTEPVVKNDVERPANVVSRIHSLKVLWIPPPAGRWS